MKASVGELQAVSPSSRAVRPLGYRLFVAALFGLLVGAIVVIAGTEGLPSPEPVVVFAGLVVATENRDRLFGDETSISSSIVVAIASVFAFRGSSPLLGPLMCAACAGVYWPHLRERAFAKIAVNASTIGLSALAAAGTVSVFDGGGSPSPGRVAALAIPAAVVYWMFNTSVLAAALSLLRGAALLRNFRLLVRSETQVLGFAVLGALCGYVSLRHGLVAGSIAVVSLLVIIDVVIMTSRPRASKVYQVDRFLRRALSLVVAVAIGALCADWFGVGGAVATVVVGVLGATFVMALVRMHHLSGVWDRHLAAGMVIVEAPLVTAFALAGVVAGAVGIGVASAALSATLAAGFLVSKHLRRHQLQASTDDRLLASVAEQAVLEGRSLPTTLSH